MIDFEKSNDATTPDEIFALEQALGVVLPADYKAFLLQQNGGRPREYEASIPEWGSTPVARLLGVSASGRSDIAFQAKRMASLLPAGVIPVGDDPGGNYFCLDTTKAGAGSVLLWDHESSTPDENEGETEFKLYRVAPSFNAFLASLRRI